VSFATVGVPERGEVMLFYATSAFALSTFSPAHDSLERAVMPLDHFNEKYCGSVELLDWLVEAARARLARRAYPPWGFSVPHSWNAVFRAEWRVCSAPVFLRRFGSPRRRSGELHDQVLKEAFRN
jgi:hypothetical protein